MEYITEKNRIAALENGAEAAEITFPALSDGAVVLDHTWTDPSLRGRGVAAELVRRAAEELRRTDRRARVSCSYAAAWFRAHPEYTDVLL